MMKIIGRVGNGLPPPTRPPPPMPVRPMPQVRVTQLALEDLQVAVQRGIDCWNLGQMTDALQSMQYFLNAAQEEHKKHVAKT
jgi:hypothetical protein